MLTAKLWNMLWNLEKKKCVWFILVSRNQLRISPMEPPIPVSNVGRCLRTASLKAVRALTILYCCSNGLFYFLVLKFSLLHNIS